MIVSGGIAFIWVDPRQGGGWSWPEVYRAMAFFMIGAAVFSALFAPRLVHAAKPASVARNDVLGFVAVAASVAVGFAVSVGQYLPTIFAGAGRVATLTTEAVTLSGGADRRIIGVYAFLQSALPLLVYGAALALPALIYRRRRGMG